MTPFERTLSTISNQPLHVLDSSISLSRYTQLDLSEQNPIFKTRDMGDPMVCQSYIDTVLKENNALVAYGGYLEKRALYSNISHFNGERDGKRNVHIGVDFWAKAGTKVVVPVLGKVHSFKNNRTKGDYGPTIILSHNIAGITFYTLYGHLSLESLNGLYVGREFSAGETLATLGTPDINVNYAPHLHFQLIGDIGEYEGDYPGVCTTKEKEYYVKNCPNPEFLLKV